MSIEQLINRVIKHGLILNISSNPCRNTVDVNISATNSEKRFEYKLSAQEVRYLDNGVLGGAFEYHLDSYLKKLNTTP